MSPMTMPKPSEQAKAAFQKLVPPDPAVTTRPMFGNLAGFVNGNMFCGLFGEDLFVRVSDDDQGRVRKQGGKAFEPMAGTCDDWLRRGPGRLAEEARCDAYLDHHRAGVVAQAAGKGAQDREEGRAQNAQTGRSKPSGITREVFFG